MRTRFIGKHRLGEDGGSTSPLEGIANLFDVMLVFAVGLLVAFLAYSGLTELITEDSVTIVKNPGTEQMTIITKDGEEIEINMITEESAEGLGEEVGKIYRLPNGETIYVPAK
jgi:hypothetical protein